MKYLIIYFALWFITSLIYFWRVKSFGVSGLILASYSFSALISILFNGTFLIESDVMLGPVLFLFICILIPIFPLLYFGKFSNTCRFRLSAREDLILFYFLVASSFLVVEALFEILFVTSMTNSSQLGAIYDTADDVIGEQLSFIGRKTLAFVHLFRFIWPVLLFAVITSKRLPNILVLVPVMAILTDIMENYAGASRVAIVRDIMMLVIAYIIFKPSLKKKVAKIVKYALFAGFVVFSVGLMLITVSRYNTNGATSANLLTWLGLYIGEAPIRFSDNVWTLDTFTDGDYCFSFFRRALGLESIIDLYARDDFYSGKLGIPVNIFYTFIGDFVIDFDKIGAVIFACLLSAFLFFLFRHIRKRGFYSLYSVFALTIFCLVFEFGFMYFVFKNFFLQKDLIMLCIALLAFRVLTKYPNKRKPEKQKNQNG